MLFRISKIGAQYWVVQYYAGEVTPRRWWQVEDLEKAGCELFCYGFTLREPNHPRE